MKPRSHAIPFRPRALACLVGLALAGVTHAAGLGEIELRSYVGEPLSVRVPIKTSPEETLDANCFVVMLDRDSGRVDRNYNITLVESLRGSHLQIRGNTAISEPIVKFVLRAGCDDQRVVFRDYTLLLDLPPLTQAPAATGTAPAAAAPAASPAPAPAPAPHPAVTASPAASLPAQLPAGVVDSGGRWQVYSGDSLSRIAAGIYPKNRAYQARYIAALRQLNPDLTNTDDDAVLTLGSSLVLPDLKTLSAVVARTAAMAPTASAGDKAPSAKPAAPAERKPAEAIKPAPQKTASRPSVEKEKPASPPTTQVAAPARQQAGDSNFHLRLSGAEMDLSRMKGVSEATRQQLREKQLLLDTDDQVAALLAMRNTVKQLESRINEMQLKLSTAASATAPAPVAKVEPPTPAPAPQGMTPDAAGAAKAAQENSTAAAKSPTAETPAATENAPSPATGAAPVVKAPAAAKPAAKPEAWYEAYLQDPNTLRIGGGALLIVLLGIGLMIWRRHNPSEVYDDPLPDEALPGDAQDEDQDKSAEWHASSDAQEEESTQTHQIVPPAAAEPAPAAEPAMAAEGEPAANAIPFEVPPLEWPPASQDQFAQTFKFASPPLAEESSDRLEVEGSAATTVDFLVGLDDKPVEERIRRLQYMYERYPELTANTISIDDADSMINAARLYYEEGAADRACELLTFGVEERPQEPRFWLAQFEIFRLEQRVSEFSELAAKFQMLFGHTEDWPKVRHVGHQLDPANPLYAAAGHATLAGERFDPMAENWLNAPRDATTDALAEELRGALFAAHGVKSGDFDAVSGRLSANP